MNKLRAQAATEYLILFAIVLLIVMFVVYILNTATSISGQSLQAASQSYWSSLSPFAISDSSQNGTALARLSVQNTGSRELVMNRITLTTEDGLNLYTNNTATIFLPGQKRAMRIVLDSNVMDCTNYIGKAPNRYSVFISYDDDPLVGKVFNSTNKLLAIPCSS